MRLPAVMRAQIARNKLTDYLLSLDHPLGQYKAMWLLSLGFRLDRSDRLARAIRTHAARSPVTRTTRSAFGTSYVVDGKLTTPLGRTPHVRVIWFIEHGEEAPKFVTLYPLRGKPS